MAAEERCLYVQKTKKGLTGARRVCRTRRNVAKRGEEEKMDIDARKEGL